MRPGRAASHNRLEQEQMKSSAEMDAEMTARIQRLTDVQQRIARREQR